jgi:hypothetical protein
VERYEGKQETKARKKRVKEAAAAEELIEAGHRAAGEAELQRALAFYRKVGATRYIQQGEALLAASA